MSQEKIKEGQTGAFSNISNEEYHKGLQWAYSNSDLKEALISPSNLVLKRTVPQKETEALLFGTAVHLRFEHYNNQDEYLKHVCVPPKLDKRTKAGKEAYIEWQQTIGDKIVLDEKHWDSLEGMLEAVQAHPDANLLLNAKGVNEETLIWQDKDTGVICKCRPDKMIHEAPEGLPDGMIIDWKTTAASNPHELERTVHDYKYHMQAAFYSAGYEAVYKKSCGPFVNVFMSKTQKRVILGVIDEEALEVGRMQMNKALEAIAHSQKTNNWSGFVDLSLPSYALRGAA